MSPDKDRAVDRIKSVSVGVYSNSLTRVPSSPSSFISSDRIWSIPFPQVPRILSLYACSESAISLIIGILLNSSID